MKSKLAAAVMGCMMVLSVWNVSAEETEQVTMRQIVEANEGANFLKEGISYQVEIRSGDYTEIDYADSELKSITFINGEEEYTEVYAGNVIMWKEDGEYQVYLCMDENWYHENQRVFENTLDMESSERETIEECVKDGDVLRIRTRGAEEDTRANLESKGMEYEEGSYMELTYTVDAKTWALQEVNEVFVKADGTEVDFGNVKVTYNPERPEVAEQMYQDVMKSPKTKTITFVLDPDTETEKTFTATISEDCSLYPAFPEGYEDFYYDRECTEKVEDDVKVDPEKENIFYSIPSQK